MSFFDDVMRKLESLKKEEPKNKDKIAKAQAELQARHEQVLVRQRSSVGIPAPISKQAARSNTELKSTDSTEDILTGIAIGMAVDSILDSSSSGSSDYSGGGGDFSGGGSSDSW